MSANFAVSRAALMPPAFPPPWASAYGHDQYGLWLEFAVGEAVQRLRWIAPGWFVMGSPEQERARIENPSERLQKWLQKEQPQHRVQISTGFWLADTACTQALWQAVMGANPARFDAAKGGSLLHPVESVSWLKVQEFLNALNACLGAGGLATLPTEAEWEYACRAGSQTPFSFGMTIHSNQVNHDGNYPYGDAEKSEYRAKTVAVKALPANAWGLYQMHGNVWEWCADGLRVYSEETVLDPGLQEALAPPGGLEDLGRVLRGGSWPDDARDARSASRDANAARLRYDDIGFRLALRLQ